MSLCKENCHNYITMSIVVLQSQEKVQKTRKTKGQLFLQLFYFSWPSSRDWTTMINCKVILTIFHAWWHIFGLWKIVVTSFQCIVVFQLWGNSPKTYTPGFESATQYLEKTRLFICWAKTENHLPFSHFSSSGSNETNSDALFWSINWRINFPFCSRQ